MNRDQLKAEFRGLVVKNRRAIDEGFEPGIERMLDGMADVAGKHAASGEPKTVIPLGENDLMVTSLLEDGTLEVTIEQDGHAWEITFAPSRVGDLHATIEPFPCFPAGRPADEPKEALAAEVKTPVPPRRTTTRRSAK